MDLVYGTSAPIAVGANVLAGGLAGALMTLILPLGIILLIVQWMNSPTRSIFFMIDEHHHRLTHNIKMMFAFTCYASAVASSPKGN
jgi:hypothetical protein